MLIQVITARNQPRVSGVYMICHKPSLSLANWYGREHHCPSQHSCAPCSVQLWSLPLYLVYTLDPGAQADPSYQSVVRATLSCAGRPFYSYLFLALYLFTSLQCCLLSSLLPFWLILPYFLSISLTMYIRSVIIQYLAALLSPHTVKRV